MDSSDERVEEFVLDWLEAQQQGRDLSVEDLCRSAPELGPVVAAQIARLRSADWMLNEAQPTSGAARLTRPAADISPGDRDTEQPGQTAVDTTVIRPVDDSETLEERLGDYILESLLGKGGMGEVYRARHVHMGRLVALKVLPQHLTKSPETVSRFRREVEAAARLEHPNIVAAYAAGSDQGRHFLAMQLIEGRDLGATVRESGPMSVDDAVDCVRQCAEALAYAHESGVVHRDIKPANLLRDNSGRVYILDMGLARLRAPEDQSQQTELTQTGVVMGTPAYMAPEQADDTRSADARSDLYSLGCTLHFLLTGKPPFEGDSFVKVLLAHRRSPVPQLTDQRPDVPSWLNQLLQRMLAKAPEDRFQSADELLHAIQRESVGVTYSMKLRRGIRHTRSFLFGTPGRITTVLGSVSLVALVVLWISGLPGWGVPPTGTLNLELTSYAESAPENLVVELRKTDTGETISISISEQTRRQLPAGSYEILTSRHPGLDTATREITIREDQEETAEFWWEPPIDAVRLSDLESQSFLTAGIRLTENVLRVDGNENYLQLSDRLPRAFDLEFTVRRTGPPAGLKVIMARKEYQYCLVLGGDPGRVNGFLNSEGLEPGRCDSEDLSFPEGQPVHFSIQVRPKAIRVRRNGERRVEWRGNPVGTQLPAEMRSSRAGNINGICLAFDTAMDVTDLKMKPGPAADPLDGDGPTATAPSVHTKAGWDDYLKLLGVAERNSDGRPLSAMDLVDLGLRIHSEVGYHDNGGINSVEVTTLRDVTRPVKVLRLTFHQDSQFASRHIELLADWIRRVPVPNRPRLQLVARGKGLDIRAVHALHDLELNWWALADSSIEPSQFTDSASRLEGIINVGSLIDAERFIRFADSFQGYGLALSHAKVSGVIPQWQPLPSFFRLQFWGGHPLKPAEIDDLCRLSCIPEMGLQGLRITRAQALQLRRALTRTRFSGDHWQEVPLPAEDLTAIQQLIDVVALHGGTNTIIGSPGHGQVLSDPVQLTFPVEGLQLDFVDVSSFDDAALTKVAEAIRWMQQTLRLRVSFGFSGSSVTSEGMQELRDLSLYHVDLENTAVNDTGLAPLAEADVYRGFRLNENITQDGLSRLASESKAHSYELYGTNIDQQALRSLNRDFVHDLELNGFGSLTDATVSTLESIWPLRSLRLINTSVTPEQLVRLRSTRRLLNWMTGVSGVSGPGVDDAEWQSGRQLWDFVNGAGGRILPMDDPDAQPLTEYTVAGRWVIDLSGLPSFGDEQLREIGSLLQQLPSRPAVPEGSDDPTIKKQEADTKRVPLDGRSFDLVLNDTGITTSGLSALSGNVLRTVSLRGLNLPDNAGRNLLHARLPLRVDVSSQLVAESALLDMARLLHCDRLRFFDAPPPPSVLDQLNPRTIRHLGIPGSGITKEHLTSILKLTQLETISFVDGVLDQKMRAAIEADLPNCEISATVISDF